MKPITLSRIRKLSLVFFVPAVLTLILLNFIPLAPNIGLLPLAAVTGMLFTASGCLCALVVVLYAMVARSFSAHRTE